MSDFTQGLVLGILAGLLFLPGLVAAALAAERVEDFGRARLQRLRAAVAQATLRAAAPALVPLATPHWHELLLRLPEGQADHCDAGTPGDLPPSAHRRLALAEAATGAIRGMPAWRRLAARIVLGDEIQLRLYQNGRLSLTGRRVHASLPD